MAEETKKGKILVVENYPHVAKLWESALSRSGFEAIVVDVAGLPGSLEQAISENRDDISWIISDGDLGRNDFNGVDVVLRACGKKVLAVTGSHDIAANMVKLGAAAFLAKPVSVNVIIAIISSF